MDSQKKPKELPIGIDNYEELIEKNYLHIDKTLLIKDFWNAGSKVTLITRPRRFGKSITLSMVRHFFEKTDKSTAYLFENSNIWKEDRFQELQGTHPVITISFKDVKCETWESAYEQITELLVEEIDRVITPIKDSLSVLHKRHYDALITQTASPIQFGNSLKFMTQALKKHYKKNVIVLIDEYDTPITYAYLKSHYEQTTTFMRDLFSAGLKGNDSLEKGLMTGVVRTAKDGILSGLNNPKICTMLDWHYSDKFGFTEEDTNLLLTCIGRLDKKEELKSWYNGYVVGSMHLSEPISKNLFSRIYNPWSVLQYMDNNCQPDTYWANTGSTELLERLIAEADERTQKELMLLMEGQTLEKKEINQNVILLDLDDKGHEPWSFLFFAGYITAIDHVFQDGNHYYTLAIPNEEIVKLYKKLIKGAISRTFSSSKLIDLHQALIAGDDRIFGDLLEDFICSMCSFHDLPKNYLERSLHLFILGLLASLQDRYIIKSNLESGFGRYDICLHPRKGSKEPAVILEFKKGKDSELEKLADEALQQIRENRYESLARDFGYKGKVICYGIAGFKKRLVTKMEIRNID